MSTDPFSQRPLGKFETVATSFPAFLGLLGNQGYLGGFFVLRPNAGTHRYSLGTSITYYNTIRSFRKSCSPSILDYVHLVEVLIQKALPCP